MPTKHGITTSYWEIDRLCGVTALVQQLSRIFNLQKKASTWQNDCLGGTNVLVEKPYRNFDPQEKTFAQWSQ